MRSGVGPIAMVTVVVCLAVTSLAQDVPKDIARTVDVAAADAKAGPTYYKGHQGHNYERQTTTLQSGDTKYAVHYRACIDERHGDKVGIVEGYIGLSAPCNENFYGGGFFKIFLNGKDVGEWRLADRRMIEEGARGTCQYIWETPMATVCVRFLLLPGTRFVCCELRWDAKEPIETAEVKLLCFPSCFTTALGRKGERHVISAAKDVMEGKPFVVEPATDSWLFYCDGIFDVARGEGAGPCAAMFLPDEVSGGSISIGSYGVTTRLALKPETGRARFVFWEFPGIENDKALAALRADAAQLLETLPQLDFTPACLQRSATAGLRAEFAELFAEAGAAADPCRERIEELLAKLPTDTEIGRELSNWQAEIGVLGAAPKLQRLRWELRIRALLERGDRMREAKNTGSLR
ncbi:MAG: hypothetical protein HN742_22705 [Lentisphaerae bacterium]|jgi:hypothetical protein|nr:hypothetical protein [Lentisphaerota bacterium]MBT5612501.1 hypothetical protein [Lentisphaerota bacterium]MBT7844706.1 hypothetical protein [Lentisphaerota bacterium]